jgi:guanylate cyclase
MRLLGEERARSERLLLNILPAPIAERLKASEESIAEHSDGVTVLFADRCRRARCRTSWWNS